MASNETVLVENARSRMYQFLHAYTLQLGQF